MLLFDGHVWTDDGGLGMSTIVTIQFNENVGDETIADVTSSAMIDEGDDCDDFWLWEEWVGVYIGMGN